MRQKFQIRHITYSWYLFYTLNIHFSLPNFKFEFVHARTCMCNDKSLSLLHFYRTWHQLSTYSFSSKNKSLKFDKTQILKENLKKEKAFVCQSDVATLWTNYGSRDHLERRRVASERRYDPSNPCDFFLERYIPRVSRSDRWIRSRWKQRSKRRAALFKVSSRMAARDRPGTIR